MARAPSDTGAPAGQHGSTMIPYQADPSLHPVQPAPPLLDDGCSPPASHTATAPEPVEATSPPPVLPAKSDF